MCVWERVRDLCVYYVYDCVCMCVCISLGAYPSTEIKRGDLASLGVYRLRVHMMQEGRMEQANLRRRVTTTKKMSRPLRSGFLLSLPPRPCTGEVWSLFRKACTGGSWADFIGYWPTPTIFRKIKITVGFHKHILFLLIIKWYSSTVCFHWRMLEVELLLAPVPI